ncbi:hypothetical protein [Acetobacter fallax]|uniref:Uncharacterized protein n=1 Tax=Acetobacter fallax TaxID=1737473 RepID=A0ABX0KCI1_9PROT|nr:hypothetical protein [Acetobacter fallax]NHO32578.1 hypothetical protein [Acetobacter fallax]NHO36077.1 hypothetical protein [Acetobacter fallax]
MSDFLSEPGLLILHASVTFVSAVVPALITLVLPRRQGWLTASVALWIPAIMIAFWLPSLLSAPDAPAGEPLMILVSVVQGILISPTLSLPLLTALSKAHPNLSRTAEGLGANGLQRIVHLWLPLLRYRLIFGVGSGALLACLMARVVILHAHHAA